MVDKSLEDWWLRQMPAVAKKLKLVDAKDKSVLHVGGEVKTFIPRIPWNPADGEDVTVPRVCCGFNLLNCLIGARHNFNGPGVNTRLYLYEFVENSIAMPSLDLTKEPNRAGEVWIVPHRMANWDIKPDCIGELRCTTTNSDFSHFVYVMMFSKPVRWNNELLLKADTAYTFEVQLGQDIPITDLPKPVDISVFHDALHEYRVLY